MNTPIFDLMDEIVSDASQKVNNFKSFVDNDLQNPKPMQNLSDVYEDRIHDDVSKLNPVISKEYNDNPYLTQINQSFNKLKVGAERDKLSDTFRSEDNKEARFTTTRSTQKTINSFNRYYSIIQANC